MLFLPVFLVLLVLFIVLSARARPERTRERAVIASIENHFPPFEINRRLRAGDEPLASRSGTVFAVERLDEMGDLFATTLPLAKVNKVAPGRLMEVRLPADALFVPDTVWPRPERQGLLDRVVDALRMELPGERVELDAFLSIDEGSASQGPGPVPRAGALARTLIKLGAPARSVTVGVERGEPGGARLLFAIRESPPSPSSEGRP